MIPLVFKVSEGRNARPYPHAFLQLHVGTKCNGCWEDMPTIIVRVFTDQINPSQVKESAVSLSPKTVWNFACKS